MARRDVRAAEIVDWCGVWLFSAGASSMCGSCPSTPPRHRWWRLDPAQVRIPPGGSVGPVWPSTLSALSVMVKGNEFNLKWG